MAVDWTSPTWGKPPGNVHHGSWVPDEHDKSEQDAEDTR